MLEEGGRGEGEQEGKLGRGEVILEGKMEWWIERRERKVVVVNGAQENK